MNFVRTLVQEKTGLKIDQPDPRGGTTSTGSVARRAFSNDPNFIECMMSVVGIEHKDPLLKVHTQLSAILRIFNDRKIKTWANISPTLHKLLAYSEEIVRLYRSFEGSKKSTRYLLCRRKVELLLKQVY